MDEPTRQLIAALHRAPYLHALAVTGGGATAAAQLLSVPGGSNTVVEVVVPYHRDALAEYLGHAPDQSCSADTSRAMARQAFARAARLVPGARAAGVGCTASLVTDYPKRGEHRCHISTHTAAGAGTWSVTFAKGQRDREGEEAVVGAVLLNALAETFGVPQRVPVALLAGEAVVVEAVPSSPALARLYCRECPALCAEPDGRLTPASARPAALMPGSFNPLHAGHRAMAEAAARRLNAPVAYELSVDNVDKPALAAEELSRRLRPFAWHAPVWLTRAPTFLEKARLFPGATFVVGFDTAARLVGLEYYGGSGERMRAALDGIRQLNCRFLVGGRVVASGAFRTAAAVEVPATHRDLFAGLSEAEFRLDVSATQIRAAGPPS